MTFDEIQMNTKGSAPPSTTGCHEEFFLMAYLGEDDFYKLAQFFRKLFFQEERYDDPSSGHDATEARLIVFITRRCYLLAQAYLSVFLWYRDRPEGERPPYLQDLPLETLEETAKRQIMTDSALLSMSGQLADIVRKDGVLPKILIADEIVEHGQSLNSVISGVEERMQAQPVFLLEQDQGYQTPESGDLADPVAALSEALELYTYAQNTQTLLLYPRYQKVLQATQVYEPVRWRTLSKNITTALAVSDINETVSGWSIRISSKDAKTIEDLVWNSSDQYHGRHFTRIVSGKSFRQVHYLCFYPNPSKPKFIGAIGIKKSAATGDLLISPTILLGELSLTAHCDLHRQLTRLFPDITFLSANDDHLTGNERLYARWLVETNLLFLGRILFQKWEQEIAAQIELFSQSDARQTRHHFPPIQLDVRQTAANFATLQQALDPELPSVSEELERWFWNDLWSDTETMGHLIAASLSEATPVWPYTMKPEQEGQHFFQKKAVTAMVDEQIENTVWRKGQQWEKEAYQLYMSGLSAEEHTYTKDSHQYPLRRLFSDIFAALDNGNVPYAQYYRYYVVASILRMQEMGTLDIEPAYQAQEESCYLNVHMGEPATTILPARYEKYILALQAIQKNCQENQLDLEREIQRFVKNLSGANTRQDNTDLAEKLFDFVKKLTASGQSLDEWRFSMATCSTQLGKQFKNARNSMIDMISTQFWYLYQYQQIS